jgi:hypothetical protein
VLLEVLKKIIRVNVEWIATPAFCFPCATFSLTSCTGLSIPYGNQFIKGFYKCNLDTTQLHTV